MTITTKALAKGTIATFAGCAIAMASVAPAYAQDRERRHDRDGGISAGEVIAGAVILGGIAAVIASSGNNRDRNYRDRDYRDNDRDYRDNDRRGDHDDDYGYGDGHRGYNARVAVDECVRAAERQAQRYSGANAEVFEVGNIDRQRSGFEIRGRIALRNDYRGRGWGDDYRRGNRNNGWDEGRFTCEWRGGRVANVEFRGLRNL